MKFPEKYKILNNNIFQENNIKLVPIRYEDRLNIMKWRNDQMYHLRQSEPLTEKSQNNYFKDVVSKLFVQEKPNQILFSYLQDDVCIGYGGLVHINWQKKIGEVSFIMSTKLEKEEFSIHWSNFLKLLYLISFRELNFNSIFTYAYNLRPHLYPVLEKNGFLLKKIMKEKIKIEGKNIDVYIHQIDNPINLITTKKANRNDIELIFNWSNEKLVRKQSFNSNKITYDEHIKWFNSKFNNKNSILLINKYQNKKIGLVRFEIQSKNTIVSLMIDKEHRGKGYSYLMLIKSCREYFLLNKKPIFAHIKTTNIASIKSFEKAGFLFHKKDLRNNIPIIIYRLDKYA